MQKLPHTLGVLVLAALGLSAAPVHAANRSILSLQTSAPAAITAAPHVKRIKPLRLAQRTNQTRPSSTFIPPQSTGSTGGGRPSGGGGKPSGGGQFNPSAGAIGIGIIGAIINQPRPAPRPVARPRPRPLKIPKYTSKPKPKSKSRTKFVRRPPARKAPPQALVTIPQFVPNEVLVFVKSDQAGAIGNELATALNLILVETVPVSLLEGSLVRFRYTGNRPLRDVLATLTADPRVTQAQPNNWYHPVAGKTHKKAPSTQYPLAKLAVGPAHEISKGRGVPVAVIDTGIDARHPALSHSIASSFDAVGDGKKAVNRHGTAIAGLIAGRGKVGGVAPLAKVMAVRAFYMHKKYNKPMTSSLILLRALDWSFKNDARIFNMSFTGPYDPLVRTALEKAHEKGVILVAAAGNGGPKAAPAYPAAYRNVIAITALDHKDRLYAHANRGSYLTAAAPGVDVLVPSLKKGYRYSSGTSLAAAHVSGLIALLLERHPDASSQAILDAIQKSAHDLGPKGYDTQFGAGRADALASLNQLSASQ